MSFCLYPVYKPDIFIVSIFLIWHIIDFMLAPPINIKMCYLEIEYSPIKTTTNNIIAFVIRMIVCLIPTPLCTIIGQMCSSVYEFVYSTITYKKQIGGKND